MLFLTNKYLLILLILSICVSINNAHAGLVKDQIITVDQVDRTYDIYVPNKTVEGKRPLVFLLHGHFGNADVMTGENNKPAPYKVWLTIAEREGWYLLIPDGAIGPDNHQGWNDCRANSTVNSSMNDVKFINSLADTISSEYPIDKYRMYVHGTSNGGNMAYRLAQEAGDKYRAIAAIVSQMSKKSKCTAIGYPISVLIMNGTKDPILPYQGGEVGKRKQDKIKRGKVISTKATVEYWLENNAITSPPKITSIENINKRDGSTVQVIQYMNDKNNTEVILYKVRGGGHIEPSLTQHIRWLYSRIVGRQNKDFEMAEEVWRFFNRNN